MLGALAALRVPVSEADIVRGAGENSSDSKRVMQRRTFRNAKEISVLPVS